MSKGMSEGRTPHLIKASIPSLGHWRGNASFQSISVANTAVTSVELEFASSKILVYHIVPIMLN